MIIDLSCTLREEAVVVRPSLSGKPALFDLMASRAQAAYGLDPTAVRTALDKREALGSTGFGAGVAIPHARMAAVTEPLGLFARLEKPLDYGSIDERPVDIVFCLLSQSGHGARHLKALAEISRTLRNENHVARLRSTSHAGALYGMLAGLYEFDGG